MRTWYQIKWLQEIGWFFLPVLIFLGGEYVRTRRCWVADLEDRVAKLETGGDSVARHEAQKANERMTEHVANHQSGVYKPPAGEFTISGKVKLQP